MFCPNCGEKLPEGSAFCGNCGMRLPRMHAAGSAGREDTAAAPGGPTHENASGEPAQNHRTRLQDETGASSAASGSPGGGNQSGKGGGGRKAVLAAVIAAAAVIVLAAAVFLSISGNIPGSVSGGGQENDDGVITVTFDCGTEETSAAESVISSDGSWDDTEAELSGSEASVISSVNYAPETQDVTETGLAQCPAYPTKDGYIFGGWYTDEDYTEEFDFSTEVTEDLTLYAKWLDPEDEEAQITQEDLEIFTDCLDSFDDIYAQYADDEGYVDESEVDSVLNAMADQAESFRGDGIVTFYSVDDDSVYIEFESLLTYIFDIPAKGTDGDLLDLDSIMALPYYGDADSYDDVEEVDAGDDAIAAVIRSFSSDTEIIYGATFDWEEGLSFLEDCNVFIWRGHGGYDSILGPYLGTTISYGLFTSDEDLENTYIGGTDISLSYAIEQKLAIPAGEGLQRHYVLTSAFFEVFLPQLDDAIVCLSACSTGRSDRLADAFLDAGAEVVLAVRGTDPIYTEYSQTVVRMLFALMSGQDEDNPEYLTVREALDELGIRGYASSFTTDTDGTVLYSNAYYDIFYAEGNEDAVNYTLWAGIEGTLSVDSALELDPAELTVSVVNDVTGATVDVVAPDEDGSFSIDRMNGGEEYTYTLYVQKGDAVLLTMEEMEVQAHRILDVGSLSVEAAQLTVYVRNEDGEILEDVSAQVTGSDGTAYEMTAGTDGAGSVIYQAKVLPGEYTISLSADGYEDRTETVTVEEDITLLEYTLEEFDVEDSLQVNLDRYTEILDLFYHGIDTLWEEYGEDGVDIVSYMWYWNYPAAESLEEAGFAFMDLDGNGIDELLISIPGEEGLNWTAGAGFIYDMYTWQDGKIVHVLESWERDRYNLSTDGTLINEGSSGASYSRTAYYQLEGADLILLEYVLYDGWTDPDNPYFYGTEEEDDDPEPISLDDARAINGKYEYQAFDLTLFSEYVPSDQTD